MAGKTYTPRPWQPQMTQFIINTPRCNLFAGMGVGKTPTTLEALSTLFLFGEVKRVLIVGPKRVARDTWPDAVANFSASFGWMTIAVAIGDEKKRRAAISSGAMITTINFDNIAWLVANYGEDWPFDMVVVDESTKLRGLRVSIQTHKKTGKKWLQGQGASRAKELARVAHTRVTRWVNLTGTPTLAGLEALWGPTWFLDAGHRLGNSFTAFSHRWFRSVPGSDPQRQVIEAMPFSEAQIRNAIQDITLVVDIKDWLPVGEPVETIIYVDLPADAQRHYDEMASELATEIKGQVVEAFSAGTKSQKCLAEGSEVLTAAGWKTIESVSPEDLLWDGVEWVSSAGAVCNGRRAVIDCWGVHLTDDHLVMSNSGWREAKEVSTNAIQDPRLNRREVRLPHDYCESRVDSLGEEVEGTMDGPVCMRGRDSCDRFQFKTADQKQDQVVRVPKRGTTYLGERHTRHVQTSGASPMARRKTADHQQSIKRLGELRRSRDLHVRPVAGVLREFLVRHGAYLQGQLATRPDRQRRTLRTGELSLGNSESPVQQQKDECIHTNTSGFDDRGRSCGLGWSETDNGVQALSPRLVGRSPFRPRVYDIVNCGPRNRFTVRGRTGEVFLAHNCLQIASGAMYTDDKGTWVPVHDEKLEVLKSVVEEAMGMPLLVFYHFKSDAARILKAFPKAVQLDDKPQTMADFKAGKIPILLAHPASAGHGVDGLQHGTHICFFYSTNWSAENDAQAIERIGPTRQMQSGYDRVVSVIRAVARGTVEESAVKRLKSRVSVQEALLDGLKKYQK